MNKQKGFTFLELIIAIFLLMVGILGTSKMLKGIAKASRRSSDQVVAAYLAQEGIELVRNIRDSSWYSGEGGEGGWLDHSHRCFEISILNNLEGEVDCDDYFKLKNLYLGKVNIGGQEQKLFYNYNEDGEITPYKREIKVSQGESGNNKEITATVYWGNKDEDKIVVKTILYNDWR